MSSHLAACEPVYIEEMPGWKTPTEGCKTWKDLPKNARAYAQRLADLTGARLRIASVGPESRTDHRALKMKPPPRHIAIIMDGNGRWAKERGLPRIKGHEAGAAFAAPGHRGLRRARASNS